MFGNLEGGIDLIDDLQLDNRFIWNQCFSKNTWSWGRFSYFDIHIFIDWFVCLFNYLLVCWCSGYWPILDFLHHHLISKSNVYILTVLNFVYDAVKNIKFRWYFIEPAKGCKKNNQSINTSSIPHAYNICIY